MRPGGLVLVLLISVPSWGLQPLEAADPVALVEELEEPGNVKAMQKALDTLERDRAEQENRASKADETAAEQEKLDSEPPPVPGDPVDVIKHLGNLQYRFAPSPQDEEAARTSKRLQKEGSASKIDSSRKMREEIQDSIDKTMQSKLKGLPVAARTWDSVFPSESQRRTQSQYGLTRSQRESELAIAEKQQLLNREHAVANAERNLAYLEHEAQHKVHQAELQAQNNESQQLEKVEQKENQAEEDEAKARADESSALELKARNQKLIQKLRRENKDLRLEVVNGEARSKVLALQIKVETNKAIDAARKAVERQAQKDKQHEQSELHTMKASAEHMKEKLQLAKSKLHNQERENAKLEKQVDGDKAFTEHEVRNAVAKAHIVSEKMWQGKVQELTHELADMKVDAKDQLNQAEEAMKQWAQRAMSYKSQLQQQFSAQKVVQQAAQKVQAVHKAMAEMKQKADDEHKEVEQARAASKDMNKRLITVMGEKDAAIEQVSDLERKQHEMALEENMMKEQSIQAQDKLEATKLRLKRDEAKLHKNGLNQH